MFQPPQVFEYLSLLYYRGIRQKWINLLRQGQNCYFCKEDLAEFRDSQLHQHLLICPHSNFQGSMP